MDERAIRVVAEPTLRRLPAYHRLLAAMRARGRTVVSCTRIASELGLDATQVRKDLASTGVVGRPKIGFAVDDLLTGIADFLGWNNRSDAVLAGAGHLGMALMGYRGFEHYRLNILAAFDCDPEKIGRAIHGKEVFAVEKLPDLVQRLHVSIGILTVPTQAAQSVAAVMIQSGIRALWNFTQAHLDVPENVIVEHVDLSASLAVLSRRLAEVSP